MPLGSVRLALILVFVTVTSLAAQDRGQISGRITGSIGIGMPGVVVAVNELGAVTVTGTDGRYAFDGLLPDTYELVYTLGGYVETEIGIEVAAGETTTVDKSFDWGLSFAESISVVSTARKRGELSQEVPMFISTVDGGDIRDGAVPNLEELSSFVPGLVISEAVVATNLFVRGIGSGVNHGFEQSVGTFVDGIYMGRGFQARAPFLDVELVEVLKRPQGVLFGKNTIAGALNIKTAEPTNVLEGYVTALYEPSHGEKSVTAVVSGPLNRSLAGRLAVRFSGMDGHLNNTFTGNQNPEKKEQVVRGSLLWNPSQHLSLLGKIEKGSFDVDDRHSQISNPGRFLQVFQALDPREDGIFNKNRSVGGTGFFAEEFNQANNDNFALRVDYNIGEYTFTSVSGYSAYDYQESVDADLSTLSLFRVLTDQEFDQWSQEVRLTSPLGRKFDYMVGAYYQNNRLDSEVSFDLNLAQIGISVAGSRHNTFVQDSRTYSAFAHGSWHPMEQLSLTAGLRYSNEEKKVFKRQLIADLGTTNPNPRLEPFFGAALGSFPHTLVDSRSEADLSPEVGLEFDLNDSVLLYANLAEGFKGGGFDEINASGDPNKFQFEEEKVLAFEAGAKTVFPNTAVILNATVFRSKFKDLQVSAFDGTIGLKVGNAAEATSQGFELDGLWMATGSLTVGGSLAYLNSVYDSFPDAQCTSGQITAFPGPGPCTQDLSGRETQFAPKWRARVTVEHTVGFGDGFVLVSLADLKYTDEFALANDLDPNLFQEGFAKIDLRFALGNRANLNSGLAGQKRYQPTDQQFRE